MRHEIRPGYLLSHAPAPTAPPASLFPMKNGTKDPSVSGVDVRARTHPRKMHNMQLTRVQTEARQQLCRCTQTRRQQRRLFKHLHTLLNPLGAKACVFLINQNKGQRLKGQL